MGVAISWLKVRDPLDKTPPQVSFAAAESTFLVRQLAPIVATVVDQNLDWWKLEIETLGSVGLRTLATGETPVDHAPLLVLDPNDWTNGFYRLILTARDISGRESQTEMTLEINTPEKSTAYRRTETDLLSTLAGSTFAFTRTYDSLRRDTPGGAGYGWRLDFREVALQTNALPTGQEVLGIYRAFGDNTRLYLTLPDGSRVGFDFAPRMLQIAGVTYYRPAWSADAVNDWQLTSVDALLVKAGTRYFDEASGQPYHPASPFFSGDDYVLTGPDGTRYSIDSEHGITERNEPGGQRLFFADSGVTTLGGETIRFVQDAEGRLARVIDPEGGTLIYQYDAQGSLALVRHLKTGQSAQYGYDPLDPHRLTLAISSSGEGAAILYDGRPTTVPIQSHLGGVGLLSGNVTAGELTAATVDRYSFGMQTSELASAAAGQVLVRAALTTQPSGPLLDLPRISGLPIVSSSTSDHRVEALFAIGRAGLHQLLVQGIDASAAGSYALQIGVAGDINSDGLVDGVDSLLLDAAVGSAVGDPAYDLAADLDGNGVIDAADRQILIANCGFTANRAPITAAQVEMADTTNDGAGGLVRYRSLEMRMPDAIQPAFSVSPSTSFFFSDVLESFAFDPTETGQDLSATLSVNAPDGTPAGTLAMLGDGELLTFVIDEGAFRTVLENLAAGTPGGDQGADANEILLIDDATKRDQLINDVIARVEQLLAGSRLPGPDGTFGDSDDGGWQRVEVAGDGKVVLYNDFLTDVCPAEPGEICPGATTLGSAHRVDNNASGGVWTLSLPAERARYSAAEENFRLSETLNETQTGHIDMYVDRYFRYYNDAYRAAHVSPHTPYDLSLDELVRALGKTFVHELGHTIGLNHPAMGGLDIGLPGAADDLMAQGLDSAGALSWMVTVAAAKVALGLEYTSDEAQQALDYYWSRVLRNFMSDRGNQLVLGAFVGIFAYCLVVLRTIRGGDGEPFVPSLAVLVGLLLG